ncbi:acyltransferase family protein [Edaphobacter aggregans]|uniref:acyltransferase family protein n=1 Tax=Edaphobacter aggregans TaxID=570835 RepID=UPI00054E1338|nr:acyltransferase [Edaphobacter aggregans]
MASMAVGDRCLSETLVRCRAEQGISSSHFGRPQLAGLTTLRFFAALHVILFHLKVEGILPGGPWWYQNFAGIGYIGVNFFFVLSGFILVYTYAATDIAPRRFWQARFARIYPAYVFSLAATAPFFLFAVRHLNLPFFAWSERHLVLGAILTVALLQAWVPQGALTWNLVCWSLSVESFFYSLFPFLLRWTKAFSRRRILSSIAVFSLASLAFSVGYILVHPDGVDKINSTEVTLFWKNVLSFNPLVRLPEFIVGLLAGRLFLSSRRNQLLGSICALSGTAAILLITTFAARIPNPMISAGFLSPLVRPDHLRRRARTAMDAIPGPPSARTPRRSQLQPLSAAFVCDDQSISSNALAAVRNKSGTLRRCCHRSFVALLSIT